MITNRHPLAQKFISLACRLSSENLCCDGECSQAEVRHRAKQIWKEWAALEKQAGETVELEAIEKLDWSL